jgi:hypothetical protein
MSACTIFKNFTVPVEDKSLVIISKWIAEVITKPKSRKSAHWYGKAKLRKHPTKRSNSSLSRLPAFSKKKANAILERYTGFLHLDFDKLTPEQLQQAFQVISGIPYTFICFVSPSGNGLKVFIEVDTGVEHHETAYRQVQKFYEEATGLKADPSCKDITRLCFMSYHPSLYKNLDYQKFKVEVQELQSDSKNAPDIIAVP